MNERFRAPPALPYPHISFPKIKRLPYVFSRSSEVAGQLVPVGGEVKLWPQGLRPDFAEVFPSLGVGIGQLAERRHGGKIKNFP